MDYYSMKRRELQALCKEHNIPANSANSVMADKLSELLNEKQKPRAQQRTCMKSLVETINESEPAVSKRQAKKVRFSPEIDLLGSELRSGKKRKTMVTDIKARRNSVANKVDNVELVDDSVQIPARLTRSRLQTLGKDGMTSSNENKQGRRAAKKIKVGIGAVKGAKGNIGKVTRSKVHTLGKGSDVQLDKNKQSKRAVNDVEKASESVKEKLVGHVRVTRSKAQSSIEDGIGPDLNPQAKKRRGRQVTKDVENVEPHKEGMDIPVRVTRARGQRLADDIENTVADPQAEKKRTRRNTSGADLSNKSSNVALDDNQQLPKRKSLRNKGVDAVDESENLEHGRRNTRSNVTVTVGSESQDHAGKGLRQSKKNKSKVEVSTVSNQNASKVELANDRKITRSRAALAKKSSGGNNKSEFDSNVENPLENASSRNVTRRKSVLQPEKTEVVLHLEEHMKHQTRKDTRQKSVMHKTEGKEICKPLDGKRGMEIENKTTGSPNSGTHRTVKENVTRSGQAASGNEMKTVASAVGSVKSRKQRGDSINEGRTIETVTSATGSHKSRKRRGDSIIEEQIIEVKYVSPVAESPRRSTRSASKSEVISVTHPNQNSVRSKQKSNSKTSATRMNSTSKKRVKLSGTSQSHSEDHAEKSDTKGTPVSKSGKFALGEEVIKSKHTPLIDESTRRFTRSAIRSEKNAVGSPHGRVGRKKLSQSAIKGQHIGDARSSSSNAAKFRRDPVLSTAPGRFTRSGIKHAGNAGPGQTEVSKGAKGQIQEHSNELSASDFACIEKSSIQSARNPTKHDTSASPNLTEDLSSGKPQTPVNLPNFEDGTPLGTFVSDINMTPFSTAKVSETVIDATSDISHLQNQNQSQEVYVNSGILDEDEVQEAVQSDKSVLKSARPEVHEKEIDSTKSGSPSMGLQDVIIEEPVVSVGKKDIMEISQITKEHDGDTYYTGSSAVRHALFEESDAKRNSNELEAPLEPSIHEGVNKLFSDDGDEQDALTSNNSFQNPSLGEYEVADNGEHDDQGKTYSVADGIDAHEMDSVREEYDLEPNKDDAQEKSTGDDDPQDLAVDEKEIKDDVVSTQDRCDVADGTDAQEMDRAVGEYDMEPNRDNAMEQSTGDDMLQGFAMDEKEITDDLVTAQDRCDVADNVVEAGKESAEEVEYEVVPSTGNDVREIPIMGKSDSEDASGNDAKEGEVDYVPLIAANMPDDSVLTRDGEDQSVDADKERESSPMLSVDAARVDDFNMNREVESDFPSVGVDGKCDEAIDDRKSDDVSGNSVMGEDDTHMEREPDLEQLNAFNTFDVPISGNNVNIEGVIDVKLDEKEQGSEQEQLTKNDSPDVDGQDVGEDAPELSHSENMAVVSEVLIASSDDSIMSKEKPQTPATSGNDVTVIRFDALESNEDINNDDLFNHSRDNDAFGNAGFMDTENDSGKDQKIMGTSELDECVSVDERNERITEEGDTTEDNHEQIIATDHVMEDGDKFVEDRSNPGLDDSDFQHVEHIESDENPSGEKSSSIMFRKEEYQLMEDIGGHKSLITEEHFSFTYKNEEQKGQNTNSSIDWGDYSFGIDEFQKPDSANGSDDVLGNSTQVGQEADLQTSARASSSMKENYSMGFVDPVDNLENASRYAAEGKSNQDMDILKEDEKDDMPGEFFDGSDLPLKALFATPATTRTSRENAASFAFHDDRCHNDVDKNGTATYDFNREWGDEPSSFFNDENQGYATQNTNLSQDLKNEIFGDFGDKEVDGSGKKEHSDDQIKQHEAAGTTHHHDYFGFNDNSMQFEIKETANPDGSETVDDPAVNKGI